MENSTNGTWRSIRVPPDTYKVLKLYAAHAERFLGEVVADAVREYLAKKGRVDARTLAGVANGGKSNANRAAGR